MIRLDRKYYYPTFGEGSMGGSRERGESKGLYFEVNCPVNTSLLHTIRSFVTRVAEEMGFDEERICQIEMAVDEACSNVAVHAYDEGGMPGESQSDIELKLEMDEHSLTIYVRDKGCGAGPAGPGGAKTFEDYHNQDLGQERYHGLGILIMKKFMDEVEFVQSPQQQGTLVRMKKYLHR